VVHTKELFKDNIRFLFQLQQQWSCLYIMWLIYVYCTLVSRVIQQNVHQW